MHAPVSRKYGSKYGGSEGANIPQSHIGMIVNTVGVRSEGLLSQRPSRLQHGSALPGLYDFCTIILSSGPRTTGRDKREHTPNPRPGRHRRAAQPDDSTVRGINQHTQEKR